MEIIKNFTSLEQSKVLAEILPIESADMWWAERYAGKVLENGEYIVAENPVYYLSFNKPSIDNYSQDTIKDIPCWSLAALLSILPTIDDRNAEFCKDIRFNKWHIYYHSTATLPIIDTEMYENLVDACCEMIIKLHELKRL